MHPILFSLGPVRLYSYGVLVAVGVLSAVLLLRHNAKWIPVDPDTVVDLAIVTVISGFVGARVFYVLQYWDYFLKSPLEIIKIWEGGIVLYGGVIGGLIGFSVFVRMRKLPYFALLDLFVPGLALSQGFGRIGCFFNGCCYGQPSQVSWAVSFPFLDHRVHPTQLYEAAFCFLLAAFLLLLWRKRPRYGTITLAYFTLYPIGRFFFEFLRGDHAKIFLNLTLHQWISIVLLFSTLLLFCQSYFSRHGKEAANRSA